MTHLLDPVAAADSSWLWAVAVFVAAVGLGAVVPVVPTGAAVSAMAALAHHRSPLSLAEVVALGAAAAWLGDVVLYRLLLGSEDRLARRVRSRSGGGPAAVAAERAADRVADLGRRLAAHDVRTLTTSRLLPGARVPVMLAAASSGYPVRRFAVADVVPVAVWACAYALLGLLGRSLGDRPWEGVLVAVLLGLAASGAVTLVQRARAR
ncbi:hypothetical protein [Kineococcus terrestris]|uniref:hypothetical protein n=1 Tax=Kineococcus terrestris TaxID=2044856 RepID=UPI0034DADB2C